MNMNDNKSANSLECEFYRSSPHGGLVIGLNVQAESYRLLHSDLTTESRRHREPPLFSLLLSPTLVLFRYCELICDLIAKVCPLITLRSQYYPFVAPY